MQFKRNNGKEKLPAAGPSDTRKANAQIYVSKGKTSIDLKMLTFVFKPFVSCGALTWHNIPPTRKKHQQKYCCLQLRRANNHVDINP